MWVGLATILYSASWCANPKRLRRLVVKLFSSFLTQLNCLVSGENILCFTRYLAMIVGRQTVESYFLYIKELGDHSESSELKKPLYLRVLSSYLKHGRSLRTRAAQNDGCHWCHWHKSLKPTYFDGFRLLFRLLFLLALTDKTKSKIK